MKTITKHFDTDRKAMAYQNRLYNLYNSVQLVRAPRFGESGTYVWQVTP